MPFVSLVSKMTLKQSLLKTLSEDGPQTVVELKERMEQAVAAGSMRARGRGVQAGLWELRHDGKVERDGEGVYTALVQPDPGTAPRPALGQRRQEALTRLQAVLEVNKDRIPPEVARALMSAWQEYIDAFGEDIRTLLEKWVEEALPRKETDVQAR